MRLHASREIEASPSSIFAAFEDEARLARWWGPDGFTSTFQSFSLEPGRMWTFVMHGPDGKDYKNQISVLEVVPSSKIVLHHVSGPRYLLTVTLESTSGGYHRRLESGVREPGRRPTTSTHSHFGE